MRYPTSNSGSKEEFYKFWYSAQNFGNPTTYGVHEGEDINFLTGGESDFNQEVKAISNGRIVYYHKNSHPMTGFGRHIVIRIDGLWGTRWIMYSHLNDQDFLDNVQDVTEGQIIGRIGKSGTSVSHLHFSIFKIDPITLRNGIDTIAKNQQELNDWWENPFEFIDKWTNYKPQQIAFIDQTLIPIGGIYGSPELQALRSILNDKDNRINDLTAQLSDSVAKIENIRKIVA